ncbi:MAG TPA: tetratricopeptide repeat protein [Hyphomicrobiaceae bacterium]|nr:tetratricopeptide repeat protein [Hyphomicrobiaceae bacterium]
MKRTLSKPAISALCALLALVGTAVTAFARGGVADLPDSKSLLGSYLAGRYARALHETDAAAALYRRALAQDPANEVLMESALLMEATEGHWEKALPLARDLAALNKGHRMARLILGLAEFKEGRHDAALEHVKASSSGPLGELTGTIASAWIRAAKGEAAAAADALGQTRAQEWAQFHIRYHHALLLDVAGRPQDARAAYRRLFEDARSRALRFMLAYGQHLAASGETKQARTLLDDYAKRAGPQAHPEARALAERLKGPAPVGLLIETPVDGLAELFYGLGAALASDGGVSLGAIYLQLSLYLKPSAPFALTEIAGYYEATKRYEDANDVYERISKDSSMFGAIQIRKAQNLDRLKKVEEAKTLLEAMAKADPTDIRPLDALGLLMRGHKRYEEAIGYYTKAIALIGRPEKRHWTYFYARGTSYERIKRWPAAEADLLKAMQLAPDQHLVLNYLGYTWVDQNRNLKQGLALIEKAVSLKRDDADIVDSLGWAHFRLGNFKDAAKHLERAVELRPEDPTLNDHFGDALWRVGREREARFQWGLALSLNPEPQDAEKIKLKLEKGLPALRRTVPRGKDRMTRSDTTKRPIEPRAGLPSRPAPQ